MTSIQASQIPRPEWELILLCARMTVDPLAQARINALMGQDLDWNFVLGTAHQHRVLPLVWRTLSRTVPDGPPELVMGRLRAAYLANAKRNLFLTSELFQVADVLRAQDIPSVPYKGPVLASLVYGDIGLRQFADLDIIVPAADVVRARQLMVARGYCPEKEMSDDELRAWLRVEKHITMLRDELGINLEIHWGITTDRDPIQIRPRLLWGDLRDVTVAGTVVKTHSYENLLLIQCVHGGKHRWERLGWLCDVAEIVRSSRKLNWKSVIENAEALGATRILLLGLTMAKDLLGAAPPPEVLKAIREDADLVPLSKQVTGWLFHEGPVSLDLGEREQYFMNLRERSKDKLWVAVQQAKTYFTLTSRDTAALPRSGGFTGLLYLLRPIRLAREYGLAPFKRFFRGVFQC